MRDVGPDRRVLAGGGEVEYSQADGRRATATNLNHDADV